MNDLDRFQACMVAFEALFGYVLPVCLLAFGIAYRCSRRLRRRFYRIGSGKGIVAVYGGHVIAGPFRTMASARKFYAALPESYFHKETHLLADDRQAVVHKVHVQLVAQRVI